MSGHYYYVEKLKIVEKQLCKLNCSYGKVSHALKLFCFLSSRAYFMINLHAECNRIFIITLKHIFPLNLSLFYMTAIHNDQNSGSRQKIKLFLVRLYNQFLLLNLCIYATNIFFYIIFHGFTHASNR